MSISKHESIRVWCDRRERSCRARSVLRSKLEKPLYDAVSLASAEGLSPYVYCPEVIMALSDLFPSKDNPGMPDAGSADDPDFAVSYPVTWSLVSSHLDDVGKPRETSTLLFFLDGGAWKVRLSERNHRLDLWAGGSTFIEALGGLEAQLLKRPVPWRKQTIPSGRSK